MKMLLITEDELKVALTKGDLEGFGIKIEDIDYDNTETRRVFWSILDDAKRQTGFDAALSRIFIQIYPCSDGGCDMYVSRIGADKSGRSGRRHGVACAVEKPVSRGVETSRIYGFYRVEELLSACKALRGAGKLVRSSAYVLDGSETCYLLLEDNGVDVSAEVTEYGERCVGKYIFEYILEHCEPICLDTAVSTLGRL